MQTKSSVKSRGSVQTVSEMTKCQKGWRLFIRGLKNFIAFLFSHVGLASTVFGYTIFGGFIFKLQEGPNETEVRNFVDMTKKDYTDRISAMVNMTADQLMNRSVWLEKVEALISEYEYKIHKATRDKNWDGRFGEDEFQWSFAGSLLYSVTVITTIGYGNISPKTAFGKIMTMFYAMIGIPMTMLCLRNIGNLLAGCFRLAYRHICVSLTFHYIMLKRRRMKERLTHHLMSRKKLIQNWAKKKHSEVSSILRHDKRDSCQVSMTTGSQNSVSDIPSDLECVMYDQSRYKAKGKSERSHSDGMIGNALKGLWQHRKFSLGPLFVRDINVSPENTNMTDSLKANHSELTDKIDTNPKSEKEIYSDVPYIEFKMGEAKPHGRIPLYHPVRRQCNKSFDELSVVLETQDEDRNVGTKPQTPSVVRNEKYGVTVHTPLHMEGQTDIKECNQKRSQYSSTNSHLECCLRSEEITTSATCSTPASSLSLNDFDEDALVMKERLKQTRNLVPISMCLIFITGYIIIGAVLFTLWEENWDFLEGAYFCFITLTTIGFGDFVPGSGVTTRASTEKRVLCALYLLFGMSLIAMSFHLIQEEVIHKIRNIAIKLGLLEKEITRALDSLAEDEEPSKD